MARLSGNRANTLCIAQSRHQQSIIKNRAFRADISHIKAHFNNAYVSHILSTSSKEPIQEDFNVLRVLFYDYLLQNVGPDSWILTVDAPYSTQ